MIRSFSFFLIILLSFQILSAQDFSKFKNAVKEKLNQPNPKLTEQEITAGLKEALERGVESGVESLSAYDGYYRNIKVKIPLPDEAKEVEDRLRKIGQGKIVDEAIESINRAAEDAAFAAKDIFLQAIQNMEVDDAIAILKGADNAATQYLEKNTRSALFAEFKTVISNSLSKVGATKHWNAVFTTYNKIPFVAKVNPDMETYATNKAIDGLFLLIAEQELEIRKNPAARVSDILKRVFK